MRTRLCIHPVSRSCRMPASTMGKPVNPPFHAAMSPGSLRHSIRSNRSRIEWFPRPGSSWSRCAYQSRHASWRTNAARPAEPSPTTSMTVRGTACRT